MKYEFNARKVKEDCVQWIREWFADNGEKCNAIIGLSGGKDLITLKPLRKGYQIHHRNLDEKQYQNLREDWFLPCNNLTHKVIHWLYTYFQKDEEISDRLKAEMLKMKEINGGRNGD